MRNIIITSLVMLIALQLNAQDIDKQTLTDEQNTITYSFSRLRLGIELGASLLMGEIKKPEMVRETQSYYNYGDAYYNDYGFISEEKNFGLFYLGVKPEYLLSKRFAVSAGVRFSYFKANLKSDKDCFLWRTSSNDDTKTNYVSIKSITQKNYYIGIPLEVRFFPSEKDYAVRPYFLFGTTLNFLITSTNDVEFKVSAMGKYSDEIKKNITEPNSFHILTYLGAGLKIGKMTHPFGSIEVHLPMFTAASSKSNSFVKTDDMFGIGIRASVHIPLMHNHQLIYTIND